MIRSDESWCILRTSGRTTLRLAETLAADGFDVWTPRETRRVRVPRMNVKRDVVLPLMPSYVFARSRHLIDLLQLTDPSLKTRWGRPMHASFSVMHWHDSIPLIADNHLNQLRRLEIKRTPLKKADRRFTAGVDVRVKEEGGSFQGMRGRVERSDEAHTLVCFDHRMTVKIATSLLDLDGVGKEVPYSGVAALKAA